MTLPPNIRIFFAIDLPEQIKKQLEDVIALLKKNAKSHGIRWIKPENLHITLQFLPQVYSEHLPLLIQHVQSNIAHFNQIMKLTIGSLQLFPSPYRPRVIVLSITPQDNLVKLSELIGAGIQNLNYEIEKRPFRAHLTLGRIKYTQDVDLTFLSQLNIPEISTIEIKEVILFRSEPQPDGSKYTVLERVTLTK